jgi:uncharacterized protein YggU (UPF0235/DUF167 family)
MLFKLKVKPGCKENKVEKLKDDEFRVFVKVKPEQGLANQKVLELLSEYLHIPKQKISLIKGHTSPSKIVRIRE